MAKVRVYQLAKELGVQSALVLELLDRMGQEVKSDLSTLDLDTAEVVRARVTAAIEREKKRIAAERKAAEARRRQEQAEGEVASGAKPAAEAVETEEPEAEEPETARLPEVGPAPEVPEEPAIAAKPAAPAQPASATPARPGKRVFVAKRTVPIMTVRGRTVRPPVPGAARPGVPPAPPRPGAGPRPAAPHRGAPTIPRPPRRKKRRKEPAEVVPRPSRPKPELPPVPETITLSEAVTVKELAEKLNRRSKDVISKLITRGVLANINQPLNPQVAIEVAEEFGSKATVVTFEEEAQMTPAAAETEGAEAPRKVRGTVSKPPVVTVMGHVDHGKTSLLDAVRATNVVAREHGGITQHIGAYQVIVGKDRRITFLDTPGHEAFTMMRARGARVTDIVVLVVAADDGVKPQTLEAIDHAKAAGVPLVVAINKIDKPEARPARVKQQLADHNVLVEEFGGNVVCCEVSAKKNRGLQDLLEMILLVADLQELTASPEKPAAGVVLEARLDRARGIVANVLVQDGTLKAGDPFIAGPAHGKVRAMSDEFGRRVQEAGPAMPVEVMGFAEEPAAGDSFQVVPDEARARQIASYRQEKKRAATLAQDSRRTLESLSREIAEGQAKELPMLLKADVRGSLEALEQALGDLPADKIRISILRTSTGGITQADVLLASASNAIIVGFNVRPDRAAAELARRENVEIRLYSVIYELVDEIKQAMVGMLEPTFREKILGQAEVRQIFRVPKVGTVAGCYVTDGKIARNSELRLIRDHVVIFTGKLGSLRRFKDDVSDVKQGFECGIGIANYNDIKEGDVIESFVMEEVAAESL